MSNFSAEAKVGVFVVIGLVIFGYMSMKMGSLTFSREKGYDIEVLFDSATGLAKDVTVEIAGVEVGQVKKIALQNGKALVVLRMNPGLIIRKDDTAIIRTRGILGDKYVELIPGSRTAPPISPGERITRTAPITDMDVLMNTLGEVAQNINALTRSLSRVLGTDSGEATLRSIIDNVQEVVSALNQTVQNNKEDIGKIVDNLITFTGTLKEIGEGNKEDIAKIIRSAKNVTGTMEPLVANLTEITNKINQGQGSIGRLINDDEAVENLNQTLSSLKEIFDRIKNGEGTLGQLIAKDDAIQNLNKTLASLSEITDTINRGEGTIGKLVREEETVETLNETLTHLNTYMEKQETFQTYLDYRGEYLTKEEALKSYLSLRIQPKEDKYYLFQIVDDPTGTKTSTDTKTTTDGVTSKKHKEKIEYDSLKFSAQVAKRYYDIGLRGGLFESTGGLAFDYYLLDDRMVLSFESFDFDLDDNPHLKTRVDFFPFPHLYLTAGLDDFISEDDNESFFFGAGLNFSDNDIKTIISSVPLPK
jgi:phospholipid/cholesterol/gamma-HCH transport system substrate-binding protein